MSPSGVSPGSGAEYSILNTPTPSFSLRAASDIVSRMAPSHEVTRLLREWAGGAPGALEELTPLVYGELRRLAASYLRREGAGHTLQPTALVNEAWLRLVENTPEGWQNRSHFYGVAARLMRQILVDYARTRQAQKRGGGLRRTSLAECAVYCEDRSADLLALDEALSDLDRFDTRKCKIVELRYFGGLTVEETAAAVGLSVATVGRELRTATAWLFRYMRSEHP